MKILIIDDHKLFADGLKMLISDMPDADDYSIDQAYSAEQAIGIINKGNEYDLILTDLDMPETGGHDLVQTLRNRDIGSYIVVISASNSQSDIRKAHSLGAKGYISKSESSEDMQEKLKILMEGKISFPVGFLEMLNSEPKEDSGKSSDTPKFGRRPIEVLNLLEQGKSNKQIAAILNISETTVKFHVRNLFSILEVNNRTWCVREAVKRGVISSNTSE